MAFPTIFKQGDAPKSFADTKYSQLSDSNSSVADEDGLPPPYPQRRNKSVSSIVIILLFSLFNLAFVVTLWFHLTTQTVRGTVNGLFPKPEYEIRVFHDDNTIAPGPENDRVWKADLPHGRGFTIIENSEQFGLPPGQAYGDGFGKYGVVWAHQYHCLSMLKTEFWRFIKNESKLVGVDMYEKTEQGAYMWHLAHCYDYLRRHVVCNMDMSLEWPTLGGTNEGTINGYEIAHTCKKRELLDEYMDKHEADRKLEHDPKIHKHEHGHEH